MATRKTTGNIMAEKYEFQYDERLSTLEADVKHVNQSVDSLARSVGNLVTEIRSELKEIREGGKITWPLIMSAIGTIVSVTAILGALFWQSMQPMYLIMEHAEVNSALAREVIKKEADLEKEIVRTKFDLNQRQIDSDILYLQSHLEKLVNEYDSHKIKNIEKDTSQDERIAFIQKELDEHLNTGGHSSVILEISELRSKIASIEANRFTSEKGSEIEGKVEILMNDRKTE
jgi:hypothetical protein